MNANKAVSCKSMANGGHPERAIPCQVWYNSIRKV
ncbi:hypothetical protein P7134_24 [Streptococcus phage P7134]|uniref:Uncharacterized protein n=1 Tax=Streptococcus phage P7134 TaxID=1971423 RepID=A0A286QQB0_9CAUD|nr:hypothetical protein PP235_gp24 [Streptococcus phage P7134]ARU13596.1 hypothetical protein P7134_24 [Streptococcus phage P7134]